MYRVVKTPEQNGAVYTIAPESDLTKVKHVHRTLIKAVIGVDALSPPSTGSPSCSSESASDDQMLCDGDLLLVNPEAVPVTLVQPSAGPAIEIQTSPQLPPACSDLAYTVPGPPLNLALESVNSASSSMDIPPPGIDDVDDVLVRRTAQSTAGQYSNIHHLARAAGNLAYGFVNSLNSMSSSVSALYRPWY